MATTTFPLPQKSSRAINILQLIAVLLPIAEQIAHSFAKSDKTKDRISMVTGTAGQIIPIVSGVLVASQGK